MFVFCVDCCTPLFGVRVLALFTLFSVFVFKRFSSFCCTLVPCALPRARSTDTPVRELLLRVLLGRLYTFSTLVALRTVRPDCAVAPLSTRVASPALPPEAARAGPFARGT